MSNRKIETALEGYERQVFPDRLDELNRVYDRIGANGLKLEELGRTIDGYEARDRPATEDGYVWFWRLHFKTGKCETAILFPWSQDWDKHDGIQLDRSIAVYLRGEVYHLDLAYLVEKLYQGFLEQERKQKESQEASSRK